MVDIGMRKCIYLLTPYVMKYIVAVIFNAFGICVLIFLEKDGKCSYICQIV